MIKQFTSTVYIFHKFTDEWKLFMILHKKRNKYMAPGGHVEEYENPFETIVREAKEETGLDLTYLDTYKAGSEVIDEKAKSVLIPFRLHEYLIPEWKNEPEHYHVDCIYLAVANQPEPTFSEGESSDYRWLSSSEIQDIDTFDSTRKIALDGFQFIEESQTF